MADAARISLYLSGADDDDDDEDEDGDDDDEEDEDAVDADETAASPALWTIASMRAVAEGCRSTLTKVTCSAIHSRSAAAADAPSGTDGEDDEDDDDDELDSLRNQSGQGIARQGKAQRRGVKGHT
jgi:hypothetical protein